MTLAKGPDWTLTPDGDAALLVRFEQRIDPAINARAIALAAALRRRRMDGVRDVVEAYAAVTVHVDPASADIGAVAEAVARLARETGAEYPSAERRREHRLPVCYGGAHGPDLAEVARFGHCTEEEVIRRHCSSAYRVYMLGFQPGFAYLGSVEPSIAAPRRATPRVQVPARSVGIAGQQTGVYPAVSPGGWQLIGRTTVRLFDLDRPDPFLLHAGDVVRFEPIDRRTYDRLLQQDHGAGALREEQAADAARGVDW